MGKGRLRSALAALCMLALVGCGVQSTVSDPASADTAVTDTTDNAAAEKLQAFAVAYSHDDTLNPFAAATEVNLHLATLLYDSLTVMGEGFQATNSLAASVTFRDSTHLTVTLRGGAKFADGSAVTAADVVTSFKQAKASANYKVLLSHVASAAADKAGVITFTLSAPDPHAAACLSFPVVKASTLTTAAAKGPVGGGLYKLAEDDGGLYLAANSHSGRQPHFARVELRHLPSSTSMYYGLASGSITYYYDDLDSGEVPQVTTASTRVDMNALVYLGINGSNKAVSSAAIRQALSDVLDRSALVNAAYPGRATASQQPFHPAWYALKELELPAAKRDLEGAIATLQDAGYGTDAKAKRLQLELIYCADNTARSTMAELIRTQMESAAVTVTLVPLSYENYMARLKKGDFDLYLAEVRLAANMSLRPLFSGGTAGYGVRGSSAGGQAYTRYLAGEIDLSAFLTAFAADMPFIPLCWRDGFAAYSRQLSVVTPGVYDPYYGFERWQ